MRRCSQLCGGLLSKCLMIKTENKQQEKPAWLAHTIHATRSGPPIPAQKIFPAPNTAIPHYSYPGGIILNSSIVPTPVWSAAISKAVLKAVFHHSFSVGFGCHRRSKSCRGFQGNLDCS